VALKQINMKKLKDEKELESLSFEIEIMKNTRGPNIVEFIDYFTTADAAYIVMELCTSDLRK
jgi:serine/threonine protein kinase